MPRKGKEDNLHKTIQDIDNHPSVQLCSTPSQMQAAMKRYSRELTLADSRRVMCSKVMFENQTAQLSHPAVTPTERVKNYETEKICK